MGASALRIRALSLTFFQDSCFGFLSHSFVQEQAFEILHSVHSLYSSKTHFCRFLIVFDVSSFCRPA